MKLVLTTETASAAVVLKNQWKKMVGCYNPWD